ncbi:MAG: hypothetical protein A2X58_03015 [Nitrospirae bacterium GWC2_56_14]|nr:MAG: hypothetical protein A2X58_03015 [Nitrospirae bacterium GWC2_56_14]
MQFSAIGAYEDNTTQDITNQVTWISSDTDKATISNTGLATAVAEGTASITASFAWISSSATLTINGPHDTFETAMTITTPTKVYGGNFYGLPDVSDDVDDFYALTVSRPCQIGIRATSIEKNMSFTLYDNSRNVISNVVTSWWPDGDNYKAYIISAAAGTYYIEAANLLGGGYYELAVESYPWLPISPNSAPDGVTSVWTGSELIVLGGTSTTGSRYNLAADSWSPISSTNAPVLGWYQQQPTVWTGSEVLTAGNYGSGRYNPVSDVWTAISTANAPVNNKGYQTAIWTGTEMITPQVCISGGSSTGARYNLATDSWATMSTTNAPTCAEGVVWTGTEMIAWSGQSASGGRYNPKTDTWTAIATANAPGVMYRPYVFWTGKEMIVLGGTDSNSTNRVNYGYRYDPAADTWKTMSMVNAPDSWHFKDAAWVGTKLIVWANYYGSDPLDLIGSPTEKLGGTYDPETDTWSVVDMRNAPYVSAGVADFHWTGDVLLIWNGGTGARWTPFAP